MLGLSINDKMTKSVCLDETVGDNTGKQKSVTHSDVRTQASNRGGMRI